MKRKSIHVQTTMLSQLIKFIDRGRFAIPKLQREFVWDGPKAAKLFDSILAHMPIGVVMIWETPRNQRLYLRQKYHVLPPFNPRNGKVWFLIDGQQRISVVHRVHDGTSLHNARGKKVEFSRVVFSLEKEEDGQQIRYRKPLANRYESLSEILRHDWSTRLSHLGKRQKERVRKCRDRVLRYPMQLMFVRAGISQIRETFLRINTQGMKITTSDAIITGAEELQLRDIRHEVREHLDDSFGQIGEMPILFALAAVRGGTEARGQALRRVINRLESDARDNTHLRKDLAREWSRLGVCFGKTVDYLRQNFNVLSREYLYSDYMVAVLATFFFRNGRGPSAKQREQIRRWFWATTIGSRYSGSNFLRCLPEDLAFFRRLARNPHARFTYRPEAEKIDVRKAQYASRTGITAACYCMLLQRHPVSILDDGLNEIPLDRYSTSANRKDRHHIFPRGMLAALGVPSKSYNSICNICLLTSEENKLIGMRRPRAYLGEVKREGTYFSRKCARHLIPVQDESGVWLREAKKGFMRFVKERTDLICRALEDEAGIRLFRRDL
jgi:hypothetical protein